MNQISQIHRPPGCGIFISHSSRDNTVASAIAARLTHWGYQALFLDFDPANGIPAGRDWEREIYRNISTSSAMVVVWSRNSAASKWCFAEIAQARALGKELFPIVIDDSPVERQLLDRQVVNFVGDKRAYERLRGGLREAGLDPEDDFAWNRMRDPYPGLNVFTEEDAGVYFGRDDLIRDGIDRVNRMARNDRTRMALVIGASGSGKSSLVQAGIIPRLKKPGRNWCVVPLLRSGSMPIQTLAQLFAAVPPRPDWRALRDRLLLGDSLSYQTLIDAYLDLRLALHQPEARGLIVVDQFEETLGDSPSPETSAFHRLLRRIAEAERGPMFVLATLRSDFLGVFQNHAAWRDLHLKPALIDVAPMRVDSFAHVIEGPAARAGVELEPGLVQAMVQDTATHDALPILAFTLRELYLRCKPQNRLRLGVYVDDLKGVQGAVARVIERLEQELDLDREQMQDVRRAFLKFVEVGEDGRFIRKRALWDNMPAGALLFLEQCIKTRLLTTMAVDGLRIIEVAHESLFRVWPKLAAWLDESRAFLLWRHRLHSEAGEWHELGRPQASLLSPGRLPEARKWRDELAEHLTDIDRDFIAASIAEQEREALEEAERHEREVETQRQLRQTAEARAHAEEQLRQDADRLRAVEKAAGDHARRSATRLRRFAYALGVFLVISAGTALIAWRENVRAQRALDRAYRAVAASLWDRLDFGQNGIDLTVNGRRMMPDEQNALWEIGVANSSLKDAFVRELTQRADRMDRLARNPEPVLRAMYLRWPGGTSEDVRSAVVRKMSATTDAEELQGLAVAIHALPGNLTAQQAEAALRPIFKKISFAIALEALEHLYAAERALADKLTNEGAEAARQSLLKLLDSTSRADSVGDLAIALRILPGTTTVEEARPALAHALELISKTTDPDQLDSLASAVQALALTLTVDQAQLVVVQILKSLHNTDEQGGRALASALKKVAPALTAEQRETALVPMLSLIANSSKLEVVGPFASAAGALAETVGAERAERALAITVNAIKASTNVFDLRDLGSAAEEFAEKLTPSRAEVALDGVLRAVIVLANADSARVEALTRAVRVLGSKVTAQQAQRAFTIVLGGIDGRTAPRTLGNLSRALQLFPGDVPREYAEAFLHLLNAIAETTNNQELSERGSGLQSLAGKLPAAEARAVTGPLLNAMARSTNIAQLQWFAFALQALRTVLTAQEAQAALTPVMTTMLKTLTSAHPDSYRELAVAVEALAPRLTPDQRQAAFNEMQSVLAWSHKAPVSVAASKAVVALLARTEPREHVNSLLEVLKYPMAAGQATAVLLDGLHSAVPQAPGTKAGLDSNLEWIARTYPAADLGSPPACPPAPFPFLVCPVKQ